MIVVSGTSAISNLLAIGLEGILRDLFGEVLIPPAVELELMRWHSDLPAFLSVVVPVRGDLMQSLSSLLDPGETEAISLAVEIGAALLLIDERKGRSEATSLGLKTTGLLGVLLEAKRAGLLGELRPVFDDLVSIGDFRVSVAVKAEFLRLAGEA
jgi:uncharacterized protein